MSLIELLIGFIVYTALWMGFLLLVVSNQTNQPLFRKKNDEDNFDDFSQVPPSEMQDILGKVMGKPHSFEFPKPVPVPIIDEDEIVRERTREFNDGLEDEFSQHEGGDATKEVV